MQDVFNFLTELAIDPYEVSNLTERPELQQALRRALNETTAIGEASRTDAFEACRTCSDPGPDEPFPEDDTESVGSLP